MSEIKKAKAKPPSRAGWYAGDAVKRGPGGHATLVGYDVFAGDYDLRNMSCAGMLLSPHDTGSVSLYGATDGARTTCGRVPPQDPRLSSKGLIRY